MADDVTYTSTNPAGLPDSTKQATDEHATRGHMPLVKVAYSADGDATPVTVDSTGIKVNASATAVPITDNSGSLTVDYATTGSGTATGALRVELANNGTGVLATLGTITNVVHVDDNAGNLSIDDGGNSITVDYATTGSGTATGALRVELANNGTGVLATVGAVTAITNALPAGSNAIGKLAANSGVDIGDVDVTSVTSAAANAKVDIGLINAVTPLMGSGASGTGALRVELANNGTGRMATVDAVTAITNALPTGTNSLGKISDITTSVVPGTAAASLGKAEDAGHTTGDTGVMALAVRTDTLAARATTDADYNPIQTNSLGAVWTQIGTATTGGALLATDIDLDETETEIKATAATLYGWYIYNDGAAEVYVKFYNATAANVTVGSTTPVLTFGIPAGGAANAFFDIGIAFGTALTAAATTVATTADATAPAANQVVANFFYV